MKKLLPLSSLLSLALLSSCSSALSMTGTLDGEVIPAAFSGAMAETDIQGSSFVFGVWSTLSDTCGLAGLLMDRIVTDLDDADDTDATIESFFDEVPGDFWLMTTLFSSQDRLVDEEFAEVQAAGFVCHFTDGPDLSDTPKSSCGSISSGSSNATVSVVDDQGVTIDGELELAQSSSTTGARLDAGTIAGSGTAQFCPGFDTAMDALFDDCFESDGGGGCQSAVNAYVGSHTIQQ